MNLDIAGIGIGPFNLSIAALLAKTPEIKHKFFDDKLEFAWHPGLLLPEADMQTGFLKDLVTAVNPTSPYSFLSYLVAKKRFYRFTSTELNMISRAEFSDYMSWASKQLTSLQFNSPVELIEYHNGLFHITTKNETTQAKHLCLGTGKKPYIPAGFKPFLGENSFHASEMMQRKIDLTGKKVLVVGGGQTGADIVLNTLNGVWGQPSNLDWVSRRPNFQPLDEASFTNEFFTPEYTKGFYDLPAENKQREIRAQKLSSDGITQKCLLTIFQIMYQRFEVQGEQRWLSLFPNRSAEQLSFDGDGYQMSCFNALNNNQEIYQADIIIFATGFMNSLPDYLQPIMHLLNLDENGEMQLGQDFQVSWQHQQTNNIYAVNSGLKSHGIAEPQLSLMAWRSATIINHLAGSNIFDIEDSNGFINWGTTQQNSLVENSQIPEFRLKEIS